MPRNLKPLSENGYGEKVRPEDLDYLQWKLDHAQGIKMAVKRLLDQLEHDKVTLPRASRKRLKEVVKATELFQNYQNPNVVDAPLEGVPVCKTGALSRKWVRFPPTTPQRNLQELTP
jgi:hypothetical protein